MNKKGQPKMHSASLLPDALWRVNVNTGNIENVDSLTKKVKGIAEFFSDEAKTLDAFSARTSVSFENKPVQDIHEGLLYDEDRINEAIMLGEDLGIVDLEDYDTDFIKLYLSSFLGDVEMDDSGSVKVLGKGIVIIPFAIMSRVISSYVDDLRDQEWLDRKQLSEYLGVSISMIVKLEQKQQGIFPKQRLTRGRVIYSKRKINNYLKDKH